MAEETDPEYKEGQSPAIATPRRTPFRFTVRPGVRIVGYRPPKPEPDYAEYKTILATTFAAAVEEIKLEVKVQHEQTREEVRASRRKVLDAIKESPVEYVKILCEFGALFLAFSLAIHFILKIELVNPTFAVFMLIACGVYWGMARLKERSDKSRSENIQA